jgi:hypothetical protein
MRNLLLRVLVWGTTFGIAGAIFADYASYDETMRETALGGIIGFFVGAVVAIGISRFAPK